MTEPVKAQAKTLEEGDTFKVGGKTHTANKVSMSAGEVWVHITLGDSGDHRIMIPEGKEIEIIQRANPPEAEGE